MKVTAMAYKNLCQDSSLSVRWNFDVNMTEPLTHTRMAESTYVHAGDVNIPVTTPQVGQNYDTTTSESDSFKTTDTKLDSFHFPNPKRS